MSILEVNNVSKSFGGVKANVDISMEMSTLALTPPKDLLTLFTSNILISTQPVLFDLLHQQPRQISLDIFLLTSP